MPDAIVLTETWNKKGDEGLVEGYTGFHNSRNSKRGGGVSIYVRDIYNSSMISNIAVPLDICETVAVHVVVNNLISFNVLGLYRPPNADINEFNNILLSNILARFKSSDFVVTAGDLNINLLKRDDAGEEYMNIYRSKGYVPVIDKVTRVDTGSIIDHIWTNILYKNNSGVVTHCVTDHYAVFTNISIPKPTERIRKYFRDHSSSCIDKLKVAVTNFVYDFEMYDFDDLNIKCKFFVDNIFSMYNKCCPVRSKEISLKRLSKPWITTGIMESINRKHKMFIQLKRGLVSAETFNRYRNHLAALLRKSKKDYFANKFDNFNGNIARSWSLLNSLLRRSSNSTSCKKTPTLKSLDVTLDQPVDTANCFNEYFSSIAAELNSQIPQVDISPIDYMKDRVTDSFFADQCSPSEVSSLISKFVTKGSPTSEIPVFIFKSLSSIVAPYIAELFNESIEKGVFPSCLKTARVVPIYKKDDPGSPCNYRPISTLPVLSKIFELLMHKRIVKYLEEHDVVNENQFGFRAMRGTNDAIVDIFESVFSSFEQSEYAVAVLLDVSKAFDTVCHEILLSKLEHLGIRSKCLSWFCSYLTNRKQFVELMGERSDTVEMDFGVPQGSVLGPLLFIIYINDMCFSSEVLKFVHYADDSTVFAAHYNVDELFNILDRELEFVDRWLSANRLSINIGKTVYLPFSMKRIPIDKNVKIRGKILKRVEESEFLGIIMECNLRFKEQIGCVCKKLSRGIGVMYRISGIVTKDVLKKVYYAIIYPYLYYAVVVWGGSGAVNCARVTRAHRRAVKLLGSVDGKDYLSSNKLLSFVSIHRYCVLIKMYRAFLLNNSILPLILKICNTASATLTSFCRLNITFILLSQYSNIC